MKFDEYKKLLLAFHHFGFRTRFIASLSCKNILQIIYLLEQIYKEKNINYCNDNFELEIYSYLYDQIDAWHELKDNTQTLAEFLGFSESEYARFVEEPKSIIQLLKRY